MEKEYTIKALQILKGRRLSDRRIAYHKTTGKQKDKLKNPYYVVYGVFEDGVERKKRKLSLKRTEAVKLVESFIMLREEQRKNCNVNLEVNQGVINTIDIETAIRRFILESRQNTSCRDSTYVEKEKHIRKFLPVYNDVNYVGEFTRDLMLKCRYHIDTMNNERNGKPLSSATREKIYNNHKQFIEWLIDNQLTDERILNRINSIVRTKSNKPHGDYLKPEEFHDYLLNEKDELLRLLFEFEFVTGRRRSEACGITWEDVEDIDGILKFNIVKVFTRKDGLVYKLKNGAEQETTIVTGSLREKILKFKEWRIQQGTYSNESFLFSYNGAMELKFLKKIENAHARNKKAIGKDKFRFHDLRSSCVTNLMESHQVTVRDVADFVGHKDTNVTQNIYLKHSNNSEKKIAEYMASILEKTHSGHIKNTDIKKSPY